MAMRGACWWWTVGRLIPAPNAPVYLGTDGLVMIDHAHVTLGALLREGRALDFRSGTLSYLGDLVVCAGGCPKAI